MNNRVPGEGRYARLEREQRWRIGSVPTEARRAVLILDRYIVGSRLRLRRVSGFADATTEPTFKLGQKVRARLDDPEVVKLTNIYLDQNEYDVFATLAAAELRKTRWKVALEGRIVTIDQFHGRHDGLVLAEIELEANDIQLTTLGIAAFDVTHDHRYSGGALAFASDDEVTELIASGRAES